MLLFEDELFPLLILQSVHAKGDIGRAEDKQHGVRSRADRGTICRVFCPNQSVQKPRKWS